jgi:hypothetical protein
MRPRASPSTASSISPSGRASASAQTKRAPRRSAGTPASSRRSFALLRASFAGSPA